MRRRRHGVMLGQCDQPIASMGLSADGRYVVFASTADYSPCTGGQRIVLLDITRLLAVYSAL
ncbi:MAG: hypothetical protein GYB64_11590 [Chloroflexi bacterium]|nr:hypothetical protein [Chloroflexota bacterium]